MASDQIVQTPFTTSDGSPSCGDCGEIIQPPVTVGVPIPGPPGPQGPEGPAGPTGPAGPPGEGSCPVYCGVGSPEGVITAAVASLYYQRDAAITTHPQWVKRSGEGNTGWIAYAGHRGGGENSIAIGDSSIAAGFASLAYGQQARADEDYAIAIGLDARANGDGVDGFSSGVGHIVLGVSAYSYSMGEGIAIGNTAYNEGNHEGYNQVIGDYAFTANGATPNYSFDGSSFPIGGYPGIEGAMFASVIGSNARAGGDCSVCLGYDTYAWHNYCTAIGTHARALREGCTALGRWAVAKAFRSTALGFFSEVNDLHDYSVALGYEASTDRAAQVKVGSASNPLHMTVTGSLELPILNVNVDTTLTASYSTVLVDAVAVITLPPVGDCRGRVYIVKKMFAGVGDVTVAADGLETIDGAATQVIAAQYEVLRLQSSGAEWVLL
jgi:hypothetical protein